MVLLFESRLYPHQRAPALCRDALRDPSEPLDCAPSRSCCPHPSLLNRTCDGRKDIVCIGADQTDRAYDKDKNYRQHHRVLGNVLAFLVTAYLPKHIEHVPPLASEVRVANCK